MSLLLRPGISSFHEPLFSTPLQIDNRDILKSCLQMFLRQLTRSKSKTKSFAGACNCKHLVLLSVSEIKFCSYSKFFFFFFYCSIPFTQFFH